MISVIAIEGEDCGISALSGMTTKTSGTLTIVKPLELQRKMREIIDNPVIATDVKLKLFCSPYVSVVWNGKEYTKDAFEIEIGNVTANSDLGLRLCLSEEGRNFYSKFTNPVKYRLF